MKKFLSILLAVLVLGACGTTTLEAKKRPPRKPHPARVGKSISHTFCKVVGECTVRTGPAEGYPSITILPEGHVVYVVQQKGPWCYIKMYPGQEVEGVTEGWAHRMSLRFHAPGRRGPGHGPGPGPRGPRGPHGPGHGPGHDLSRGPIADPGHVVPSSEIQ